MEIINSTKKYLFKELNHPLKKKDVSRAKLMRAGTQLLCEQSFASMGIERVIGQAGMTKGSFYHFFKSKEAFALEVIEQYAEFFNQKLDFYLLEKNMPPLDRLAAYVEDGIRGMQRHEFRKGCLIGNLSQELGATMPHFGIALEIALTGWQIRVAACLTEAIRQEEISSDIDPDELSAFFWTGWEGALIRSKLVVNATPVKNFLDNFLKLITLHNRT
jgi:TetR/AcrR family transcriptional repressor of nem operon